MDYIPGYLQGVSRVFVSYPFDYIRIYLQSNKNKNFRDYLKTNSLKNLYNGISIPLLIIPIDRAIQYRLYEYLNEKKINSFYCGFISGGISSLIGLPSSYINNTYILNENKSLKNHISFLIKEKKFKSLFFGYKADYIRSILSSSIYLGVYGTMRNTYGNDTKQCIINSSLAGLTLWTITYPLETIKLEQQIKNNISLLEIYKTRIKGYGLLNLWKGISYIYLRILPSSIIGMLVYEKSRDIIKSI